MNAIWSGTVKEYGALVEAVKNNCECSLNKSTDIIIKCPAHLMIEDEDGLSHLYFALKSRERYLRSEFMEQKGKAV
jgi:hypothetical protein